MKKFKKPNLYLIIGYPKTGSKTLQYILKKNKNINYINFHTKKISKIIFKICKTGRIKNTDKKFLIKKIYIKKKDNFIFYEGLVLNYHRNIKTNSFRNLQVLKEIYNFCNIKVIILNRNLSELIFKTFNQSVLNLKKLGLDKYKLISDMKNNNGNFFLDSFNNKILLKNLLKLKLYYKIYNYEDYVKEKKITIGNHQFFLKKIHLNKSLDNGDLIKNFISKIFRLNLNTIIKRLNLTTIRKNLDYIKTVILINKNKLKKSDFQTIQKLTKTN